MKIVRTAHFKEEQLADDISEEEIVQAWTSPHLDRPSEDHPGARVKTARVEDGSSVTVVGRQEEGRLLFITTWRND
jgi:hypothetical protein